MIRATSTTEGAPLFPRVTVLAADLAQHTAEHVASALYGAEFALELTSRVETVEHIARSEAPEIVLFEWTSDEDCEDFCAALRRVGSPDRCYVVALGTSADEGSLRQALQGPANDVVAFPTGEDLLVSRLRRGLRFMEALRSVRGPRQALEEALLSEEGGEVAIRSGEVVARIHVRYGTIAWAHVSSAPATLEDLARSAGATVDTELIAALKEECRATRANFMDVLVQWGLVTEQRAQETLRAFVSERVQLALELPSASALFMPRARAYTGAPVSMRSAEIAAFVASGTADRSPPSGQRDSVTEAIGPISSLRRVMAPSFAGDLLARAMKTQGAVCAALLERESGECTSRVGAEIDPELMRAQLRTLCSLGASGGEVLAGGGDRFYMTRSLAGSPAFALFVALSSAETTLGLARATLAQLDAPIRLEKAHG